MNDNIRDYKWIDNICRSLSLEEVRKPRTGDIISSLTFKKANNKYSNPNANTPESTHAYNVDKDEDIYMAVSSKTKLLHRFDYDESSKVPLVMQAALTVMVNAAKNPNIYYLFDKLSLDDIDGYIKLSKNDSFNAFAKEMNVFNIRMNQPLLEGWMNEIKAGRYISPMMYVSYNGLMSSLFGEDWNSLIPDDSRPALVRNSGQRRISDKDANLMRNMVARISDDSKMKVAVDFLVNTDTDKKHVLNASMIAGGYLTDSLAEKFKSDLIQSLEFSKMEFDELHVDCTSSNAFLIEEDYDLYIECKCDAVVFNVNRYYNKDRMSAEIGKRIVLMYYETADKDSKESPYYSTQQLYRSFANQTMMSSNAFNAFNEIMDYVESSDDISLKSGWCSTVISMRSYDSYSYFTYRSNSNTFGEMLNIAYTAINGEHHIPVETVVRRIIEAKNSQESNDSNDIRLYEYALNPENIDYPIEYVKEVCRMQAD